MFLLLFCCFTIDTQGMDGFVSHSGSLIRWIPFALDGGSRILLDLELVLVAFLEVISRNQR